MSTWRKNNSIQMGTTTQEDLNTSSVNQGGNTIIYNSKEQSELYDTCKNNNY